MNTGRKKSLTLALRLVAGLLLLTLALHRVGVSASLGLLSRCDRGLILAAAAVYFLMYLVKALRWRYFLARQRMALPVMRSLSIYLSSSLFGAFTPGRLGEAVRILAPARASRRYAESAACAAADKGFDVALLALLLCATSVSRFLSPAESAGLLACGAGAAAALGTGWLTVRFLARRGASLPAPLMRFVPGAWRDSLREQPQRFFLALRDSLAAGWLPALAATGLFWVLHVACHLLILRALGGAMDLRFFMLCLALSSIVEFVPVTVCGMGTREYLLIWLFAKAGLAGNLAVAFGLMSLVFTYAVTAVFMSALWSMDRGGGLKRDAKLQAV